MLNGDKITWNLGPYLKGQYSLVPTYEERKITCGVCDLTLIPTTFSFEHSTVKYYNPWIMYNLDWGVSDLIYEDNRRD